MKSNGLVDPDLQIESFGGRGARPPVPGSDKGAVVFHEEPRGVPREPHYTTISSSRGDYKPRDGPLAAPMSPSETTLDLVKPETMAPSPKPSEVRDRGFEPEGSADITPPYSESNSNNSQPAYHR